MLAYPPCNLVTSFTRLDTRQGRCLTFPRCYPLLALSRMPCSPALCTYVAETQHQHYYQAQQVASCCSCVGKWWVTNCCSRLPCPPAVACVTVHPNSAPPLNAWLMCQWPADGLYGILGVTNTATQEEIRAAYKRLAHSLHPDKHLQKQVMLLPVYGLPRHCTL